MCDVEGNASVKCLVFPAVVKSQPSQQVQVGHMDTYLDYMDTGRQTVSPTYDCPLRLLQSIPCTDTGGDKIVIGVSLSL